MRSRPFASFEALHAHVEDSAISPHAVAVDDETPANPVFWTKFCKLHKTVGPLIATLASFPFIPSKWRELMKQMVSMMDILCASHEEATSYFNTVKKARIE